jgi:AcrR family transcriptional regulator
MDKLKAPEPEPVALSTRLPTPASSPRPTRRFREMRETILGAAASLFNAQGVKGVTLAEIAASVGLVTTSITYYYRRKEDLATACFLRAIESHILLASQAAEQAGVAARVSCLLALQAQHLASIEAGTVLPLMRFNDIRALPDAQASIVFSAYNQLFRQVRALLAGPETALLARDALNARAHLLLSVFNAMAAWLDRHEVDSYARVAQRVADIVLHGLASASQVWPDERALSALQLPEPPPASDDIADAFLRAATELVNEQGYQGASVEKISARLNLTKGSFYHHHDTKLDLITACFERSFSVLRHVLRAAGQAAGPGWPRSCAAALMLVRFQLSDRGPLLRSTAISALPDLAQRDRVRHTHQRLAERIADLLVDGLLDGSVRAQDLALAAQLLASLINAAAELRRWVPGVTADSAGRLYARPALLGLLSSH